ncbi:unnamed protein product [Symbiodinium sp. CCMP2592]|nr:unnamed protein product [Symbiodinium sp. CCMP2592]
MAITGYSGFYTGLDACGRCAVGGVAANVRVGESVPQIRTGLRLKAPAPSVPPLPVPPSSPPPAFFKHPQELEVMSSSKLWQLAQHLQTLGGGILPILPSHRKGLEAWILKAQKLLKLAGDTQAAGFPSELGQAAQGGFRLDVAELELPKGGKVREEFHEARKLRLQRRQATADGAQAVRQGWAIHTTTASPWTIRATDLQIMLPSPLLAYCFSLFPPYRPPVL